MKTTITRAFEISKGLAGLAGKKFVSAIASLEKEKVITHKERQKLLEAIASAKKIVDNSVIAPLKNFKSKAAKKSKAKGKNR